LEEVAAIYRDLGWPAVVAHDAVTAPYSAPSAGPLPGSCIGLPSPRSSG